jgi:hypothetical protein
MIRLLGTNKEQCTKAIRRCRHPSEPENPLSKAVKRPKSPRRRGAPKNWRQTFLAVLADTSNITAAAERASISLSWVYKTRREDAEFAKAWLASLCEGYDNLEMEVLGRLRSGKATDAAGGKFDNATAIRLLSAHRADVARARALRDDSDEHDVLDSIDAMIDKMRERAAANSTLLAAEAGTDGAGGN